MNTRNFVKFILVLTVLGLLAACGGGTPGSSATAITAQPTDQSVVAGTTATFTVIASNATGYQWQRSTDGGANFANVAGAMAASHTTPVTALADSGTQYRVVVSGVSNSVTSSAVTLTVTPIPIVPGISVHPAAQTVTEGQDASFSVTATGTSIGYQWQRSTDGGANFANIAGATNATLTLTAVPLADNDHQLRVVVSNSAGSVTSNAALLTVNAAQSAPAFTVHPASISVLTPNTATFTVVATGSPSPALQWQLSTNAGASFADIAGATGSSYTTPATVAGDNGNQHRVIANNAVGSATSNAATLTVAVPAAPNFTTHPASVTITEGQNTQFTVAVSGAPTPTLQWQLSTDSGGNWSNITGETGATFTALNVALGNNGRQFRAVATNSAGTTNSNAAVLTVTAVSPVTITTSSPLPTGTVNVAYSVTLIASGGTPPYTWTVADGYTLPSFLTLNASTGQISGTPTAVAGYGWAIRVTDSANPQQSNQTNFELYVETPCDTGFGSATVAGAPNTVEGKFCPQTSIAPGSPNAYGMVTAAWQETYPYGGGSYRENVGVTFHLATGQVNSVSFHLNDPTRIWMYTCAPTATVDYPACTGVTVDTMTGTVFLVNTVVGSGTSPVFTLNGVLKY